MVCTKTASGFSLSLSLFLVFLSVLHYVLCCVSIVQKEVLKALKRALLTKLSQCVLRSPTEDSGSQLSETLTGLIKLSADVKDIRDLINHLPNALQKGNSFERYNATQNTKNYKLNTV